MLPLGALLNVFARERRERIGTAIELSSAYRGTALLLGDVLSEDDEYTGMHSQGVVVFALAIADELKIDDEERRLVEFGALLHDIGKMSTPKEILHKPGPLDDDEWETMRKHTIDGQRMLDQVGGTLHDVGAVVRSSHERYDGSGYPDGLRGDADPARRARRRGRRRLQRDDDAALLPRARWRRRSPMRELRGNAGTQFDPAVVEAALVVLARDRDVEIATDDRRRRCVRCGAAPPVSAVPAAGHSPNRSELAATAPPCDAPTVDVDTAPPRCRAVSRSRRPDEPEGLAPRGAQSHP